MRHEEVKKNDGHDNQLDVGGGMKMLFVLAGFSGPRGPSEADQWRNDKEEVVAWLGKGEE